MVSSATFVNVDQTTKVYLNNLAFKLENLPQNRFSTQIQSSEQANKQTSTICYVYAPFQSTNWDNGYSTLHLQCSVFMRMLVRISCCPSYYYYYCCCCSCYCCYLKCAKQQQHQQLKATIKSIPRENSSKFTCLSFMLGGNYNSN